MRESLTPLLCCPDCRQDLTLDARQREGDHVISGRLTCECGQEFPVAGGVPRFIPAEMPEKQRETVEAFGWEWTHFDEVVDEHREQFLDWISPITPEFFRGKVVLDAGCGKGRHVYWAAKFGADPVLGVDLGSSVDAAFRNTRDLENAHIIQSDLYHLPLKHASLDYMYCIGVLHHLRDPRLAFLTLAKYLKPTGAISAWVYAREGNGWIVKLLNPLRQGLTSRMPRGVLNPISFVLAAPLFAAARGVYRPANQTRWLRPLTKALFYNDYLYWLSRWRFREVHSIVFDHLVAPIAFYIPRAEFESWFEQAGLRPPLISFRNANSWRGLSTFQGGEASPARQPASSAATVTETPL